MKRLIILKPVNNALLSEQLQARFPNYDPMTEMYLEFSNDALALVYPDEVQDADVQAVIDAHDASAQSYRDVFRSKVIGLAQTAVGVALTDLTAAQIKALMACLLYDAGAVDPATLKIKPLGQWLQ